MQSLPPPAPTPPKERFLRLSQVEDVTGLKKSTIYRLAREGSFPKSVQISPRCVGWPEGRVLEWVQARISAAQAA